MLRRSSFKRRVFVPSKRAPLRRVVDVRATMATKPRALVPIVKAEPVVSRPYRKLIASLACALCGLVGFTQACHADEHKGMGMKTCDLTCWPGCGPHTSPDGVAMPGCHYLVGSTGKLSRDDRRRLEARLAAEAQQELLRRARTDKRAAEVLRKVGLLA